MKANMMMQISQGVFGEREFRELTFKSIRRYNKDHREKYGEIFICCDSKLNWRKLSFPQYKFKRKLDRDASDIDWTEAFRIFDLTLKNIYEYLPYKVISVTMAEADDIIGVLSRYMINKEGKLVPRNEPVLIVSGDKDFRALQELDHVDQFCPREKKFLIEENPTEYLKDLILSGDKSDGVPNVLSPDDVFSDENKRQTTLTKKRRLELTELMESGRFAEIDPTIQQQIIRNRTMIDLRNTPKDIIVQILKQSLYPVRGNMQKTFNFLISSGINSLLDDIEGFRPRSITNG